MKDEINISTWSLQIRKGLAELCVLAAVKQLGQAHGYQLVQFLKDYQGLEFTEATVYPLLARLARERCLEVEQVTSASGPPRRCYSITSKGQQSLQAMLKHWKAVGESVATITESKKGTGA